MPLVIKTVTQPASEPVTLSDLKQHLRVTFSADDSYITSLGIAARRYCEIISKSTFINTTFDMVDDAFPFTAGYVNRAMRQFYGQFNGGQGAIYPGVLAMNAGIITFPRAPLQSVTSIVYLDVSGNSITMPTSDYVVTTGSPGRVSIAYGKIWPVTLPQIGSVVIRFVAGNGADATFVGENVKAAIKLLVGHWYSNRSAIVVGAVSTDLAMGVEALLSPEGWGSYA